MLLGVLWQGAGWLTWSFLTHYDSRHAEQAGVLAGLWGSFWLVSLATLVAVPVGLGAAIFLEEYQTKGWLRTLIEINLANLAGVPSIVYGILGMAVFVKMFGAFGHDPKLLEISLYFTTVEIPLPFGRTVLSGALTLALLILPIVIVASREALRAIPSSIRHASYALGASHWQTIRHVILPAAVPGIVTGVILAVARAVGETAPLLMIGAAIFLARTPGGIESPMDIVRHPHGLWKRRLTTSPRFRFKSTIGFRDPNPNTGTSPLRRSLCCWPSSSSLTSRPASLRANAKARPLVTAPTGAAGDQVAGRARRFAYRFPIAHKRRTAHAGSGDAEAQAHTIGGS